MALHMLKLAAGITDLAELKEMQKERRKERGEDPHVEREEWLADKRASLHARMRKRRSGSSGASGWRLHW